MAIQPDGRIVVVGDVGGDIGLARYLQDGSLDTSFGKSGIVVSDAARLGVAVVVQPGGRIVVAGMDRTDVALVAFQPDGRPDVSFGAGSRSIIDLGSDNVDRPSDLVMLGDGRMLVGGTAADIGTVVVRLSPSGDVDDTFAGGGRLASAFPAQPKYEPVTMAVQTDGRFLVTGRDLALYRFLPDGSSDPTFNGTGRVDFPEDEDFSRPPSSLMLQPDGRILVGGHLTLRPGEDASIMRLNPDGTRDSTWSFRHPEWDNPGGTMRWSPITQLALERDGHVLAMGGLIRLGPDGSIDRTLGTDGLLDQSRGGPEIFTPGYTEPKAGLMSLPDGDVLAFGSFGTWRDSRYTERAQGFAVARVALGPRGAPTGVRVEPLTTAARVSWSRPPGVDKAEIWAYEVVSSDGRHRVRTRDANTFRVIVRGIPPESTLTFNVRVVRPLELGPASAPSPPVRPLRTAPTGSWGWNATGQLGDGTTADRGSVRVVPGLRGVVALGGGFTHSLALRDDGTVWAWGWNGFGQLGDGTRTERRSPVRVSGLSGVRAIAAGAHHNLAVKADGSVWAWGWNGLGQLGDGTKTDRAAPVRVLNVKGATSVSAGLGHSLAIGEGGTVRSWGWNVTGQLGDGTKTDRLVAVRAGAITGARAVAAGWFHSLAAGGNDVLSWGWNGLGQLGTNSPADSAVPVRVAIGPMVSIAAGAYHSIGVSGGTVLPWGWNGLGQLDGSLGGRPVIPIPGGTAAIPGGHAVSVAAGAYHNVVTLDDGRVFALGWNAVGQVGNGTTTTPAQPVEIATLGIVQAVGAGYLHSLAA